MFRDVPGCSGMFRNVPGCSMFRVLSTPRKHTPASCSKGGSAIRWIDLYPVAVTQLVSLITILIRWILIYPVDSAIQRLNNRGQELISVAHDTGEVKGGRG